MFNSVLYKLYPQCYISNMKTSIGNASLMEAIFDQVILYVLGEHISCKRLIA